jgi:hypothetical protein
LSLGLDFVWISDKFRDFPLPCERLLLFAFLKPVLGYLFVIETQFKPVVDNEILKDLEVENITVLMRQLPQNHIQRTLLMLVQTWD